MKIIDLAEKESEIMLIKKIIGNNALCSIREIDDEFRFNVFINLTDYSSNTLSNLNDFYKVSTGISSNKFYFGTLDKSELMINIFESDTEDLSEQLLVSIPFNDRGGLLEGEYPIEYLPMFIHSINPSLLIIGYSEIQVNTYEKTLLLDLNTCEIQDISDKFSDACGVSKFDNIVYTDFGLLDNKSDNLFIKTGSIGSFEKLDFYKTRSHNNNIKYRGEYEVLSYIAKKELVDISQSKIDAFNHVEVESVDNRGNIQFLANVGNDVYYELFDFENESSVVKKFNAISATKSTLKDGVMDRYAVFSEKLYGIEYDDLAKEAMIFDLTSGYKNSCHIISYVDSHPFIYYVSKDEVLYRQDEVYSNSSETSDTTYYTKGDKTQRFENRKCHYDEVNSQIVLY